MATISHLESISALAQQSTTSEYFSFGLRDFLDGFYENPQPIKLADEPRHLREILQDDGYSDAYLAAMAEHLARQLDFPFQSGVKVPSEA